MLPVFLALWTSLAFAEPDSLAPLVAELAALPDHAAREARIEQMLPTQDAAGQARLRDLGAVVRAMAQSGVADRGEIWTYLYAGLSTDASARERALRAAARGATAPIVDNWPDQYTVPAPILVPTPVPTMAPEAYSNLMMELPKAIAALPTNEARLANLEGMLGDPAFDDDQLRRLAVVWQVVHTLDEQKRSDRAVVRAFLEDAVHPDAARQRRALDAARAGEDPPALAPTVGPWTPRLIVSAHVGATVGKSVPSGIVAVPSPLLGISIDGGIPAVHLWVNAWSAPLALHMFTLDTVGLPLAMLAVGPQFGSRAVSAGPFLSFGLLDGTVGLRGVFVPWINRWDHRAGLEWRVYLYPGEGHLTAYASVAYTVEVFEQH